MSRPVRFALVFCYMGIQLLYLPLNKHLTGGVAPKIWLDDYVPFWGVWVIPYVLATPWWYLAGFWAAWKMDERLFRGFIVSILLVVIVGTSTFYFYPTYMIRPPIHSQSFFAQWVAQIYMDDKPQNALPSAHVYLTTVISLYWARWFYRLRGMCYAVILIVAASTLFIQQHFILDVIAGFALGLIGYSLGCWVIRAWDKKQAAHLTSFTQV